MSSSCAMVKPINARVLFQFLEDLDNTSFKQKSDTGLFIIENKDKQVGVPRWGKVLAVGPEAESEVSVGEYILIEALGWTNGMTIEGVNDGGRFWFTDLDKIIGVSEEEPTL